LKGTLLAAQRCKNGGGPRKHGVTNGKPKNVPKVLKSDHAPGGAEGKKTRRKLLESPNTENEENRKTHAGKRKGWGGKQTARRRPEQQRKGWTDDRGFQPGKEGGVLKEVKG